MEEGTDIVKELNDKSANANTKCDVAFGRVLIMNGEKLGGVSRFMMDYDVDNTVTKVTMTMVIKRDSLKIEPNRISFDTVNSKETVSK